MVPGLDVEYLGRHAEATSAKRGIIMPREDTSVGNAAFTHLFELNVAAVVVGSLSLISTIVAVAWFLRMRRGFRHEYVAKLLPMPFLEDFCSFFANETSYSLILLLILSDMLKTLWLVLLPVVELVHGRIPSNSTFCQVSGFFLSAGIEACDMAVLLMAVHTGLYIFKGRGGLYPYRFSAYAIVATGSLMLTSLAFLNNPGFVNSGPYCYLPARPDWTNRALSWIPRYVVCVVILCTYTCIYVYVRWIMNKVEEPARVRKPDEQLFSRTQQTPRRGSVPPTPPIAYHGLIPPTPPCDLTLTDYGWNRNPRYTKGARHGQTNNLRKASLVQLGGKELLPSPVLLATSHFDCDERTLFLAKNQLKECSGNETCITGSKDEDQSMPTVSRPTTAQHTVWCTCMVCSGSSPPQIQSQLNIELRLQDDACEVESLPSLVLSPTTLNETGMPRSRLKVRRQLGQLFIYPVVYILGWIMPFVGHMMEADKSGKPFYVIIAGLISICIQGFADSLVFLLLEKPWRHGRQPGSICRLVPLRRYSTVKGATTRVGRTREEMLVDGRIARRRREREQIERRRERLGSDSHKREWWDVTLAGIDETTDEDLKSDF